MGGFIAPLGCDFNPKLVFKYRLGFRQRIRRYSCGFQADENGFSSDWKPASSRLKVAKNKQKQFSHFVSGLFSLFDGLRTILPSGMQ
jgi:hypothetical protein